MLDMKNISKIDWARLAAYIDGEGCIQARKQRQYSRKAQPHWRPHYTVQVSVGNTDPRLVTWCKENFGGFIVPYQAKKRMMFHWIAHSNSCAVILEHCLPYFIIKRKQAEIAIAFRKTYSKEYVGRGRFVPDNVIAERDLLIDELKRERDYRPEMIQ